MNEPAFDLRVFAPSMVASFCPKCGGWTMYHGDSNSSTAKEWIAMLANSGEIIIRCNPDALGGASCQQSEVKHVRNRTCDLPLPEDIDDAG